MMDENQYEAFANTVYIASGRESCMPLTAEEWYGGVAAAAPLERVKALTLLFTSQEVSLEMLRAYLDIRGIPLTWMVAEPVLLAGSAEGRQAACISAVNTLRGLFEAGKLEDATEGYPHLKRILEGVNLENSDGAGLAWISLNRVLGDDESRDRALNSILRAFDDRIPGKTKELLQGICSSMEEELARYRVVLASMDSGNAQGSI